MARDAVLDVKDWKEVERELLQDCRVFTVSRMTSRSPHTGQPHPFYRIDSADWVNIVALTPSDELVMVRQYRHGEGRVTLEIPGGLVDPGESGATAAARELLEETGYRAASVARLGVVNPNPALFGNRTETFVALGAERVAEIANGHTEETVVELVPLAALRETLRSGRISSALVVAALYWFELERAR
ncbi:MAG: NUDIX hydrolase [Myxococcota bacterium]